MAVSEEKFRNKFCNTEMSTFKFFLLSFFSMGFWSDFWVYSFVKTINKYEGRVVISSSLPIISMIFGSLPLYFEVDYMNPPIFIMFFILVEIILSIYISFKSRPSLEKMFADSGMARRLGGIWCFLFPGLYQYYAIHNLEEHYTWYSEEEEEEEVTKEKQDGAQSEERE